MLPDSPSVHQQLDEIDRTTAKCSIDEMFEGPFVPIHPTLNGTTVSNLSTPEEDTNLISLGRRPTVTGTSTGTSIIGSTTLKPTGTTYAMLQPFMNCSGGMRFSFLYPPTAGTITVGRFFVGSPSAAQLADASSHSQEASVQAQLHFELPYTWPHVMRELKVGLYADSDIHYIAQCTVSSSVIQYQALAEDFGVSCPVSPPQEVFSSVSFEGREYLVHHTVGGSNDPNGPFPNPPRPLARSSAPKPSVASMLNALTSGSPTPTLF